MDSITQARVLQLLTGVDVTYSKKRPRLVWVRSEVPFERLQNYTAVFSGMPVEYPHIQLLGELTMEFFAWANGLLYSSNQ